MRKTHERAFFHCVLLGLALLTGGTFWAADNAAAVWDHSPSGGYEVYYWDGAEKFRYSAPTMQWQHYSSFGGWYDLGPTGLSAAFIGDGNWYNLHNGLHYRYNAASDYGFFTRGGQYRFYYRYTPGQWYTSGFAGGWYMLGAAARTCSVMSDGYRHDLGTGLQFRYNAQVDYGYYMRGPQYRFYYRYTPGQWYSSGFGGGWYALGNTGRNAGVLADGMPHALGDGFWYSYNAASDDGRWGLDASSGSERFRYLYGTGEWTHRGVAGTFYGLGLAGRSVQFIGDGNDHVLGDGFTYRYSDTDQLGYYSVGAAQRFVYDYSVGQWGHMGPAGGWADLGPGGQTAAFIGSGDPFDLGNGFAFQYSPIDQLGYYNIGLLSRFMYDYTTGQWNHVGAVGTWAPLGAAGLSTTFVGSGFQVDLGDGFFFAYSKTLDQGYWMDSGVPRFIYAYGSGNWSHYDVNGSLWTLATGRPADFVGTADPTGTDLGDGYFFRYAGNVGYWMLGGVNRFHYDYSLGQWSHYGFGDVSATLSATGESAQFVGDGHLIQLNPYFTYWYDSIGGVGYWAKGGTDRFSFDYTNTQWSDYIAGRGWLALGATGQAAAFLADGLSHDLGAGFQYSSTGDSGYFFFDVGHHFRQSYATGSWEFQEGSGWTAWSGANVLSKSWIAPTGYPQSNPFVSGAYVYFIAYDGAGVDLYRWNGVSFQEVSGNKNFVGLYYSMTLGTDMYFTGAGGAAGGGYEVYRFDGTTFAEISNDQNYGQIGSVFAIGTDLFFVGSGGTTGSGWDLFRYNGTMFEEVSANRNFTDPIGRYGMVGSDMIFLCRGGTGSSTYGYDLFRWNGTTSVFEEISGNTDFIYTYLVYNSGAELYILGNGGTSGAGYDVFRWDGTTFEDVSGNQDLSSMSYLARLGNDLFFSATGGTTGTGYDLFRWNGTSFAEVSGNIDFTTLNYLATVGTDLFFAGTGGLSGAGYDLFRWNATDGFDELSTLDLTSLTYFATLGTNVFLNGGQSSRYDLYLWDGATLADVSGNLDLYSLTYAATVGDDLFFTGSNLASNGLDAYRYNSVVGFQEVSGGANFAQLDYLTTVGNQVLFRARDVSPTGFDLYGWTGAAFQELSGNMNFTSLENFYTEGNTAFFKINSTGGWDIYGWNGTTFFQMADLNVSSIYAYYTIFNGEAFFFVQQGSAWLPATLWATHYEFLLSRMP